VTTSPSPQPHGLRVDPRRLRSGGVATAVVAALVAVVGILVVRGVLDIAVLAPEGHGAWDTASMSSYAVGAAVVALVATGLMHLLLVSTPRPQAFFGWIMFLVAVVVAVWPFTTGADLAPQVATAVIDVVIVLAIWSLLSGSADRSVTGDLRG
jgi:hypothetical protein